MSRANSSKKKESKTSHFSQAVSLANQFHKREGVEGIPITVGSGRKCTELLPKSSLLTRLLKTLLASSIWGSMHVSLIWKAKATKRGRLLFQLVPLERSTEGAESSSSQL